MTDTFVSDPKLTCCKMTNCSQAQTDMSAFPVSSWRWPHLQSASGCYPYNIHASIESMGMSCHPSHYYSPNHSLLGKTAGELSAPPAAFPALWDLCRREETSWAVLAWSLHVLWPVCKDRFSYVAFTAAIKLNLKERPCRLSLGEKGKDGLKKWWRVRSSYLQILLFILVKCS